MESTHRSTPSSPPTTAHDELPQKQAKREDGRPTVTLAQPPPPLPPVVVKPTHVLQKKTVAFCGSFKMKKSAYQARVVEVGGRATSSVSSKTNYLVWGCRGNLAMLETARQHDIPVWSEEEFLAVCPNTTTTTTTTTTAAPVVGPPPPVARGSHPLFGATVVLTTHFKTKKQIHEARLVELGGKRTTSVSSKTTHVVRGANSSPGLSCAEQDAIGRGIPLWTEEQFEAVCKDGWSGMPPPKPVPVSLQRLAVTHRIEERHQKALFGTLAYQLENDNAAPKTLKFESSCFEARKNRPKVGSYGMDVVASVVTAWAGSGVDVRDEDLHDSDVKVLMEAIAARQVEGTMTSSTSSQFSRLNISNNNNITNEGVASLAGILPSTTLTDIDLSGNTAISDEGALTIAEVLPQTQLKTLDLRGTAITGVGIRAVLKAVENTPSMKTLFILGLAGSVETYREWWKDGGKASGCYVFLESFSALPK